MKKEEAQKKIEAGLTSLHESLAAGKSEEMERYLKLMSKFHHYSFGNVMLMLVQRPNVSQVAGYTKWKELGRQVKRGATGIGILAPMRRKVTEKNGEEGVAITGFKIVHVFDISDTEGQELPGLSDINGEPGEHLARIEAVIRKHGIELVEDVLEPGTLGTSGGGKITIRSGLEPTVRLAVTIHECAHEKLHQGERKHETTKAVRETEAEAVSFVVLNALGLDSKTRSSDYIQLHRGSAETLAESLEHIQKTALHILEEMEAVELESGAQAHPGDAVTEPSVLASRDAEGEDGPEPIRIGRADYEERRETRIARLEGRAEKARGEASGTYEQAKAMASVIPFGQPILVGHHSEKRDRNYRNRIHGKFQKSFELHDKAKHYEARAAAAEGNRSISSDDPEAVVKLREKLEQLEEKQDYMKQLNAAWRKAGKPNSSDIEGWTRIAKHLGVEPEKLERMRKATAGLERFSGRDAAPCAPFQLQNNNAEIRRIKARIAELKRGGTVRETSEVDHGICRVVENVELNRIQLLFSGKPEEAVRKLLKQHGFRWARSEGAWQRHLNDTGRQAAKWVIKELRKGDNR